jgi:hypothetical protein
MPRRLRASLQLQKLVTARQAEPRAVAVMRAQQRLSAVSYPRLHMTLIAGLTGGFGLLSSFVLLRQGVDSMAWRYPLALVLAYAMFLCLIGLWLRTQARDYADLVQLPDVAPSSGSDGSPGLHSGGGGDFGGAGGGGMFDSPATAAPDLPGPVADLADAAGSAAEADELAVPLLAVVLAVGLALASLYVIYIAPVLLAEVLVDGALSYALYRHVRGAPAANWLATVVRRTALPFIATGVFLALAGYALAAYAPGARSISEVVRQAAAEPW